jgi:hypothetical protein
MITLCAKALTQIATASMKYPLCLVTRIGVLGTKGVSDNFRIGIGISSSNASDSQGTEHASQVASPGRNSITVSRVRCTGRVTNLSEFQYRVQVGCDREMDYAQIWLVLVHCESRKLAPTVKSCCQ